MLAIVKGVVRGGFALNLETDVKAPSLPKGSILVLWSVLSCPMCFCTVGAQKVGTG